MNSGLDTPHLHRTDVPQEPAYRCHIAVLSLVEKLDRISNDDAHPRKNKACYFLPLLPVRVVGKVSQQVEKKVAPAKIVATDGCRSHSKN